MEKESSAVMAIEESDLLSVLQVIRREYDLAKQKHPSFPCDLADCVSIITEELGELAKERNDGAEGWRERALTEAAHVAVTALRTMQVLMEACGK